jgi:hypothetical protein
MELLVQSDHQVGLFRLDPGRLLRIGSLHIIIIFNMIDTRYLALCMCIFVAVQLHIPRWQL